MQTGHAKQNLVGLPERGLAGFFAALGEKPFRARQVMQWIHQRAATEFAAMTDRSKPLRARLDEVADIALPRLIAERRSADGTVKWLFDSGAGQAIETVFIPEPGRGTLCVSSQVGCALDCAFCATGAQGFNRNLSSEEIIGQVCYANRVLPPRANGEPAVTNVVFMGMGEPLANYRSLLPALELLLSDFAYGLSRRRITVSTAGLVPNVERLGDDCNVSLAVSLHAPNDALRDDLVPINRVHPIAELLDACRAYPGTHNARRITFEYVMLRGVNDSLEDARGLVALLRDIPAKVNLIPFNPWPGAPYDCSAPETIAAFADLLNAAGLSAPVRTPRGRDILAACGQLKSASQRLKKTEREAAATKAGPSDPS